MGTLKVEDKIRDIIFKFLDPKQYQVFIFGSRVTGKAKKFSDYDVGIWSKKPVPAHILVEIEEELEESYLLYRVDIVDFSLVTKDFKKIARSKIKELIP